MSNAATAALVKAFEECDAAWRERWERRPRAVELVHAFEICLVSSPEELVSDVDDCVAMMFPEKPTPEPEERRRIRPMDLDVTLSRRAERYEPDTGTVSRMSDKAIVLELMLEMRETTLVIDYKNPGGMNASELRAITKAKIVPRYVTQHKVTIERALLRPLEGIEAPFELDPYEQ